MGGGESVQLISELVYFYIFTYSLEIQRGFGVLGFWGFGDMARAWLSGHS